MSPEKRHPDHLQPMLGSAKSASLHLPADASYSLVPVAGASCVTTTREDKVALSDEITRT